MRCIYCLLDKSDSEFRKREHVIPQCFGVFSPENLILYKSVCDECNKYFGDNIELFWGRDSLESIERMRLGLGSQETLERMLRITNIVLEGPYKGAKVNLRYNEDNKAIYVEFQSQVGIYNKNVSNYQFFEKGNIPTKQELENKQLIVSELYPIKLLGIENSYSILLNELKNKGIEIQVENEILIDDSKRIPIETSAVIDRRIFRGICKVAFNYLAKNISRDIVLKSDFNQIRNFIRYDKGNTLDFVNVNEKPILHYDRLLQKNGLKTTQGHLITLHREDSHTFTSRLSIYNLTTYKVILTRNYRGIEYPFKKGHHFDIETHQISKLKDSP